MDFLSELNEKQYLAVTSRSKYLRIIAGAGTGKTRVLTYRIAYLLSELSYRPYEVLAITFTNKVANEMKERTKYLLEDLDLKDLKISTFHSFCNYFLRREINHLGFPASFTILDESDKKNLLKEIVKEMDTLNNDLLELSKKYIENNKCLGKLPGDIEFVKDNNEKEYLEVFKEYEKRKNAQFSLDFDDLLIYTCKILKSFPEVKEKYNRRFKEILIDEFQDTNELQFTLLKLLVGENTTIFVVGDPDQTIYTWRGANQRIILDFENYFSPLDTIILNENYRSTQKILDHANSLISFNKERIKKDLYSKGEKGSEVGIIKAYTSDYEAHFVINKIKEIALKENIDYSHFAILYRSSYLSRSFEKELMLNNIPYVIYGGIKFYERKEIKDALAYFNLMINPLDNVSFLRIINVPKRKIGDKTISIIKEEAENNNLSYYNYIKEVNRHVSKLGPNVINKLNEMVSKIEETKEKLKDNYEAYSEVLNDFLRDVGYFDYLAEFDDKEDDRLENVGSLIIDIREYLKHNPESTFDEYLQNITLTTAQDEIDSTLKRVNLMTVHTAKGLEFDYCFVVGFQEGIFPNARSIGEFGDTALEEERRLAYVALTRGKKELYISYNTGYSYTLGRDSEPSRFIKEANLDIKNDINNLFSNKVNQNIYSFNNGSLFKKNVSNNENNNKEVPIFGEEEKKAWNVGDKLTHTVFGNGTVKEVNGNIIVVDFDSFGIKKMAGNHKNLSKK